MIPFDLHALGTPPAFILSQDQTLHLCLHLLLPESNRLLTLLVRHIIPKDDTTHPHSKIHPVYSSIVNVQPDLSGSVSPWFQSARLSYRESSRVSSTLQNSHFLPACDAL